MGAPLVAEFFVMVSIKLMYLKSSTLHDRKILNIDFLYFK